MSENVTSFGWDEHEYLCDPFAMLWPEMIVDDDVDDELSSQGQEESDEIESYLWIFNNYTEPQTLKDIGFDLNITPELMYLFLPSSVHQVNVSSEGPISGTQEKIWGSSGNVETFGAEKGKKPKVGGSGLKQPPVKKRVSINTSRMTGNFVAAGLL